MNTVKITIINKYLYLFVVQHRRSHHHHQSPPNSPEPGISFVSGFSGGIKCFVSAFMKREGNNFCAAPAREFLPALNSQAQRDSGFGAADVTLTLR